MRKLHTKREDLIWFSKKVKTSKEEKRQTVVLLNGRKVTKTNKKEINRSSPLKMIKICLQAIKLSEAVKI